jgi:hypothetical protein
MGCWSGEVGYRVQGAERRDVAILCAKHSMVRVAAEGLLTVKSTNLRWSRSHDRNDPLYGRSRIEIVYHRSNRRVTEFEGTGLSK